MKKFFVVFLSVLMLSTTVFSLNSCSKKEVLTMATDANFSPYEYMEGEEFAGIDVEIAKLIAEKLNMTLKIENVEFGSIIDNVKSGKYDIGMAAITVNEKRKQDVDFSVPYAEGYQAFIVSYSSNFSSIEDLFNHDENNKRISVKDGIKVGVQKDTTGDSYASSSVSEGGFESENVIRYKDGREAVLALEKGECSAVIIDDAVAKTLVASSIGLKILYNSDINEQYAICVNKENQALLSKINKAIEELKAEGKIDSTLKNFIINLDE